MVLTSSVTMQSLGKIVLHVPAVGAKMWCLFVFFCHAQSIMHSRGYILNRYCIRVYMSIFILFSLFQKGLTALSDVLVFIFVARWRHNVCKIAVKNCD